MPGVGANYKSPCSLGKLQLKYLMSIHNKKFDKSVDLATTRFNQFPALILAISNNAQSLCIRLLDMGWNINEVRRKDGSSTMHAAVMLRNLDMIKMLLKYGAKSTIRDNLGNNPLMKCVATKHDEIGRNISYILMSKMKDIDFREGNEYGDTLLHIMSRNCTMSFRMFKLIMERGVDVNSKDEFVGRTFFMEMLMHFVDEKFIIEVGKLALKFGLNMETTDSFGSNIVHRIVVEQKMV